MEFKRGLVILLFCLTLVSSLGVVSSYQFRDCFNTWDNYNEYTPAFGKDNYNVIQIGPDAIGTSESAQTTCLNYCEQTPHVLYCAYTQAGNGRCYGIFSNSIGSQTETYPYDNFAGLDENGDGDVDRLDYEVIDKFTSCGMSDISFDGMSGLNDGNKMCVPVSNKDCEDITAGKTSCLQKACAYQPRVTEWVEGQGCTGQNTMTSSDCWDAANELKANMFEEYNSMSSYCNLVKECDSNCEPISCESVSNADTCTYVIPGCSWQGGDYQVAEESSCIGELKEYCFSLSESECSSSLLCDVVCQEDYAQCEGEEDSACEYLKESINTDHCGSCNSACYSPFVCVDGSCESPCSDDKNFKYRKCYTGAPCSESTSDYSCCSSTIDCVYSGKCYSSGDTLDIDSDGDNEICQSSNWYECRSDSQCGENQFCNDENYDYRCYEEGACSGTIDSEQECNTLKFQNCVGTSGPSYENCCDGANACEMNNDGTCVTKSCNDLSNPSDCENANCSWNILDSKKSCLPSEELSTYCSVCNTVFSQIDCCQNINGCAMKDGECKSVCSNANQDECGTDAIDLSSTMLDCEELIPDFESCANNAGESNCCGYSDFDLCEMVGNDCVVSGLINDYRECAWEECLSNEDCNPGYVCDIETHECILCTPQCDGKDCGSDGCGGICGTCPGEKECNENNNCVEPPQINPEMFWGKSEYVLYSNDERYLSEDETPHVKMKQGEEGRFYMFAEGFNFQEGEEVIFEVWESDGRILPDDSIKNITGSVNGNGVAYTEIKINQTDLEKAGVNKGLEGDTLEFYFIVNGEKSSDNEENNAQYLEIKYKETIQENIEYCRGYTEETQCSNLYSEEVAKESVEANKGEGYCGVEEIIINNSNDISGCDWKYNKTILCECSWNSVGGECGPNSGHSYQAPGTCIGGACETSKGACIDNPPITINTAELKIGSCSYKENTSADPNGCDDGVMHYEWTGEWNWGFENEFNETEYNGLNPAEKIFCVEDSNGKYHFDPEGKYQECISSGKTNEVSCPAKLKLPFFGTEDGKISWVQILAIILIIVVIYYLISKNKCKKSSKKKKGSNKKQKSKSKNSKKKSSGKSKSKKSKK